MQNNMLVRLLTEKLWEIYKTEKNKHLNNFSNVIFCDIWDPQHEF